MGQRRSGPMAAKTVLVTGDSGGIGRATALGLAAMGAHLAICGRDPESTEGAAVEVRAAGGGQVEVFVADLSSQVEVRRLAAEVLQRLSRVDVLANNVGGYWTPGTSPRRARAHLRPQPPGTVPAHQPAAGPAEEQRPGPVRRVGQ
jgi:NAD(P)-dependent dehydrogenase (short-subunit alcohol dehydrogenase family)